MVDLNRIVLAAKLKRLADEVEYLRRELPPSPADLSADPTKQRAVLHAVQTCAQAVIDVAVHIVSAESLPLPPDARATVADLGRHGVLPCELAARLAALVGLRNLIVHEYLRIDLAQVHAACQSDLGDLARFADHVSRRYGL
jgi:uncharacterized protein YutE (UPF0331/DUF86 family)